MFCDFWDFQYIAEVKIDDIVYESIVNNQPTEYRNFSMYRGGPSFQPFDGLLKNFKTNLAFLDQVQGNKVNQEQMMLWEDDPPANQAEIYAHIW